MSIVFFRIDDRLIHGQVMTSWAKVCNANNICIVDDGVAKDTFICQIMKMAVPREMSICTLNLVDGIEKLKNDPESNRTIVLTKGPENMLALVEAGIPMKELNVGGMGTKPGRKNVLRNIQISPEEIEILKKIAAKKIRVFFQIVPDDKCLELEKI
ncbi:MAG: PTS sugar transporter subunit IIB [Clostridia bacterium]